MCGRYQFTLEQCEEIRRIAQAIDCKVHPRMPLVLTREQIVPWLEQLETAEAILKANPPLLVKTAADVQLRLW